MRPCRCTHRTTTKAMRRDSISILLLVLPASHSVAGITYDYDVATQHDGRLLFSKLSTSPPSPPAAPPAPDNTPGAYGVLILDGLFLGLMFGLLQIMMNGGVEVFVRQMRKRNGADEKKRGCCRAMKQSNDEMRDTAAAFGLSTSAARKKKGRAKLVDIYCRGDFSSYFPVLETHGTTRLGRLSMLILFYSFTLGFVWMTMGLILDVWAGIIRGPNGMLAKGLSQVATTGSFNEGEMIGEGLGAAFSQSKIWAIFAFFGSFTLCSVLVPVPWNMYLFAQFKRRVELIETGKNGTKDIYKALASGTIRLLSAEYVRHQGSSFRVERYQDLLEKEKKGVHPSPFVPKEKAVKLLKDGQVACMSYRWLRYGLPDPNGFVSGALAHFLASESSKTPIFNMAVNASSMSKSQRKPTFGIIEGIFWDYASFPQHDYEVKVSEDNVKDIIQTYWKTDEEKAQFGEGLGLMANLYSSPRVTVLRVGHYPTKQPALPGAHAYPHLNDSGFKCCAGAKRPPPRDTETWQERMADGTFEFRYGRSGWCFFESSVGSLAKFGMDSDGKVKELITDEYFRQAQPCEEGGQVLSWTGTPSATLPPCTVGNHRLTIEQFKKVYQLVGDETWTHPETEEVFSSIEFTNGKADQDQTLAMFEEFSELIQEFDKELVDSPFTRLMDYILQTRVRSLCALAAVVTVLIVMAVIFFGLVGYTNAPGWMSIPHLLLAVALMTSQVQVVYCAATSVSGGLEGLKMKWRAHDKSRVAPTPPSETESTAKRQQAWE